MNPDYPYGPKGYDYVTRHIQHLKLNDKPALGSPRNSELDAQIINMYMDGYGDHQIRQALKVSVQDIDRAFTNLFNTAPWPAVQNVVMNSSEYKNVVDDLRSTKTRKEQLLEEKQALTIKYDQLAVKAERLMDDVRVCGDKPVDLLDKAILRFKALQERVDEGNSLKANNDVLIGLINQLTSGPMFEGVERFPDNLLNEAIMRFGDLQSKHTDLTSMISTQSDTIFRQAADLAERDKKIAELEKAAADGVSQEGAALSAQVAVVGAKTELGLGKSKNKTIRHGITEWCSTLRWVAVLASACYIGNAVAAQLL